MIRNLRELWQYRALLWNLTQRELKARYRGSALGFLWTFLNPLLLMAVYTLVFGIIQRNRIPHYTYLIFVGLLPWLWFSSSVGTGASTISDRRDLLTKPTVRPRGMVMEMSRNAAVTGAAAGEAFLRFKN